MTALLTRYKAYVDLALLAILTGLAAIGFLLSALGGLREAALAVILITLGFVWRLGRDLRAYPSAFLVAALVAQTASDWLWGLSALGIIVLVVLESEVRRQVRRRSGISSQAYDLPGYTARRLTLKSLTFDVSCGLILGVWIVVALGLPTWSLVAVTLIGVVCAGAVTAHDWIKWPRPVHEAHLRSALEAYQPKFLLHFSAPSGSTYQPAMWMSYLERIGVPFVVVLREAHSVAEMRALTSAPVIVASSISSLDNAMVDSVSAIMYVNNGMKNTHAVRFSDVTHVQLLHGDSDKPPSYSPVTAMYDKIFVAGQAGIDRYAQHGVLIPREKFQIVGRPQVEAIAVSHTSVTDVARPTVLYAPTWHGFYNDTSFTSLPFALPMIQSLLALGATVIFRPHPYSLTHAASRSHINAIDKLLAASAQADGRQHRWGPAASQGLSLFECFDASDALVTDVSSVAADYLFSRKPFACSDAGLGDGDPMSEFPLMQAAYLWRHDDSNPEALMKTMLRVDPMADKRATLRTYYLGDIADQGYANAFLEAARAVVTVPSHAHRQHHEHENEEVDD